MKLNFHGVSPPLKTLSLATVFNLRIKWKVKQLQVFEESSLQSMTLDDVSLPRIDIIDDRVSYGLLWVVHRVVHIQLRIPVLIPVYRFRVLNKSMVREGLSKIKNVMRYSKAYKYKNILSILILIFLQHSIYLKLLWKTRCRKSYIFPPSLVLFCSRTI